MYEYEVAAHECKMLQEEEIDECCEILMKEDDKWFKSSAVYSSGYRCGKNKKMTLEIINIPSYNIVVLYPYIKRFCEIFLQKGIYFIPRDVWARINSISVKITKDFINKHPIGRNLYYLTRTNVKECDINELFKLYIIDSNQKAIVNNTEWEKQYVD